MLGLAACGKRTKGFSGYAFVANEDSHSIAVIDMAAFSTVRHIALNAAPTAIASHPDKPLIYILTPANGTVHEIDIASMAVTRHVQVAPAALAMRLDPNLSSIWVLCHTSRKVVQVSLGTFRVGRQIPLPHEPTDFDLSEYTNLCAVAFGTLGSVSLIDLKSDQVQQPVHLSTALGAIRFRSDGKALIVADLGNRMLSFLQTPGGRIMSQLPLAVRPDQLCFDATRGQLFITGEGRDAVVVVYPYKLEVTETVLAGRAPGGMGASTSYLFIANPLSGDVSILNIQSRKIVAIAPVGVDPGFVTFTPNDRFALILNRKSGDVAVLDVANIKSDRNKSASLFTMIPVGGRPVSAVVRGI